MIKTTILIAVKTYSGQGTQSLKEALQQIGKVFDEMAVSSVYRVNRMAESLTSLKDVRATETLEGFSLVVRAKTIKTPRETVQEMNRIERKLQREVLKRSVSLNLLVYDYEILMLPDLSLPHPEMHLRPEEVIPAAEIWPEYVHPVLNEKLIVLAKRFAAQEWGEFFAQGYPLLDF